MKLEQYRTALQSQLNKMSYDLKEDDYKRIQQSLTSADTKSKLDAISLGLNFHQFCINKRENNQ